MKSNPLEYPAQLIEVLVQEGKVLDIRPVLIEGSVQQVLRRGGRVAEGAALEMP